MEISAAVGVTVVMVGGAAMAVAIADGVTVGAMAGTVTTTRTPGTVGLEMTRERRAVADRARNGSRAGRSKQPRHAGNKGADTSSSGSVGRGRGSRVPGRGRTVGDGAGMTLKDVVGGGMTVSASLGKSRRCRVPAVSVLPLPVAVPLVRVHSATGVEFAAPVTAVKTEPLSAVKSEPASAVKTESEPVMKSEAVKRYRFRK